MTRKVYRTAQGKMVDLGALQLKNENVRAVGNMGVNARGDLLDSMNRPISSRTAQTAKQYAKQTSNVSSSEVYASAGNKISAANATSKPAKKSKAPPAPAPTVETTVEDIPAPPEDFEDDFEKPTEEVKSGTELNPPATGLAAAIARARQIKQEPLKTPRQAAQDSDGVRKL